MCSTEFKNIAVSSECSRDIVQMQFHCYIQRNSLPHSENDHISPWFFISPKSQGILKMTS